VADTSKIRRAEMNRIGVGLCIKCNNYHRNKKQLKDTAIFIADIDQKQKEQEHLLFLFSF